MSNITFSSEWPVAHAAEINTCGVALPTHPVPNMRTEERMNRPTSRIALSDSSTGGMYEPSIGGINNLPPPRRRTQNHLRGLFSSVDRLQ